VIGVAFHEVFGAGGTQMQSWQKVIFTSLRSVAPGGRFF
jgi:hypothetical protein